MSQDSNLSGEDILTSQIGGIAQSYSEQKRNEGLGYLLKNID